MKPSVRIAAIDTYLPERIRTRDEWPSEVVATWHARLANIVPRNAASVETTTEGVRLSLEAITALSADPFQGIQSVHVIDEKDEPSELDARAARQVLAKANLQAKDVDLLLTQAMVPDYMCVNQASIVHGKIGLRPEVPAFVVDGICTSFIHQLDYARRAILAEDATTVLVTQSSACTRLMPEEQPIAAWHGDAGGAALLTRADPGHGLLATAFRSDGEQRKAFCASLPGKRWHDEGRVIACSEDKAAARRMQLQTADLADELVSEVLAKAGLRHDEVKLLACHQPVGWLPEVCRKRAGLEKARTVPTFSWTGSVSSVNLPVQLTVATREGMIQRGDIVVLFAVASGMTAAAAVMRW